MTRIRLPLTALFALTLFAAGPSLAQEHGYWRASSKNAGAITGDIAFNGQKIVINFAAFTIADIRSLTSAEIAATFDGAPADGATGTLYRTDIPAAKRFLHKNTLCGSDDTEWIVTASSGNTLSVAFFSGSAMPVLTPEGLNNSALCGSFTYTR